MSVFATRIDRDMLRTQLQSVLRELGLRELYVFGSVARGDDTPNSDVDILIDLDGTDVKSTQVKTLIEGRTGRAVDVLSMKAFRDPLNIELSPTFTSEVLKDARVIHA